MLPSRLVACFRLLRSDTIEVLEFPQCDLFRRFKSVASLFAAICFGLAFQAHAVERQSMSLPAGKTAQSGFTVQVSSDGICKTGYRPFDITVTSTTVVPADVDFAIYLMPNVWQPNLNDSKSTRVRAVIEMPQGANQVKTRVLVPISELSQQFFIETYVNGIQDNELSASVGINTVGGLPNDNSVLTEAYPGILFIDNDMRDPFARTTRKPPATKDLPDLRKIAKFYPQYTQFIQNLNTANDGVAVDDSEILDALKNLPTVNMLASGDLSTNWLEYSPYDIVIISLEDLEYLVSRHRDRWAALEKFVRTGGNLIVFGVSDPTTQLNNILASNSAEIWRDPKPEDYGALLGNLFSGVYAEDSPGSRRFRPAREIFVGENYDADQDADGEDADGEDADGEDADGEDIADEDADSGIADSGNDSGDSPPEPRFTLHDYYLGQVAAINDADPFAAEFRQWNWILKSLDTHRFKWFERHGLSLGRKNEDFWNLIIPGVGAAPVVAFLVLITAFAFAIGPLNYFTLRRFNRLYLLLFTVPAGAILVTIGLLMYAFLSDGLGTRARCRSFTLIDSTTKTATAWSRQMYYAGLSPANGLQYPPDSAVYPIDFDQEMKPTGRTLSWGNPEVQHLVEGFLKARSLAQFLVISPGKTDIQIQIEGQAGQQLKATNHLGVAAQVIVVSDPDTKALYVAENVPDKASVSLNPVTLQQAQLIVGPVMEGGRLAIPDGFDVGDRGMFRRYRYWENIDPEERRVEVRTSVLERNIDEVWLRDVPTTRCYFAILKKHPSTVPMGLDGAKEDASFHVVKGNW